MMLLRAVDRKLTPACLLTTLAVVLVSGCDTPTGAQTDVPRSIHDKTAADSSVTPAPVATPAAPSTEKSPPKLRPGAPTKALAAAGDRPYDKTFDDIKFEMEVGESFDRAMLTPAIEEMVGQRIRIRGFMYPTPQQRGIKAFVLVRDNQECCFGPGAALYDCIFVEMEPGKSAEFSIRPVAVLGEFSVDEIIGPDGNHLAIYRVDAEEVGQ